MKWIAQVGHVVQKDVRQVGWMLLLYFAGIAIAVGGIVNGKSFGPYSTTPSNEILAMRDSLVGGVPLLLMILGIIVAAVVVQLDSPTRANAFWTTRPLSSSAVLTSKLLLAAVVLIGVALAGATVALNAIDTNSNLMLRTLAPAALSCVEAVLAVLVLGSLTRDLRAFVGGLMASLVGPFLILAFVEDYLPEIPNAVAYTFAVFSVAAGLWFVARLYRTHERPRSMWVAGISIAVALILATFSVPGQQPDVPSMSAGASIEIASTNPSDWAVGSHLPVNLRIAQSVNSERLDFKPDSVELHLRDGNVLRADQLYYQPSVVSGALPFVGTGVHWINVDSTTLTWPSNFSIEPVSWHRDSIAKGVKSMKVGGTVTVSRSHVIGSLPLERGATMVHDGRRVHLYGGEEHDPSAARVWIQVSALRRPNGIPSPEAHLRNLGNLQFALVNKKRGEAMLVDANSDGSAASGAIVLLPVNLTTSFNVYSTTTQYSPKGRVPRDDAWYKEAQLVVIEWTVVGQYRTSGEALVQ